MAKYTRDMGYTQKPLHDDVPEEIYSDVDGSYTGMGEDGEPPVQDADDL